MRQILVKDKSLRWVLVAGLSLMGLAAVFEIIIISGFVGSQMIPVISLWDMPSRQLVYRVTITCCVFPIVEGVAYRLWVYDKKYTYIAAACVAALLIGFTSKWYWCFVPIVVYLPIVFFVKEQAMRRVAMIVVSSAMFAIWHVGVHSGLAINTVVAMLAFMGLGLTLAYVALRWGVVWSVTVHIVANLLLAICGLLYIRTVSYDFSTDRCDVKINRTFVSQCTIGKLEFDNCLRLEGEMALNALGMMYDFQRHNPDTDATLYLLDRSTVPAPCMLMTVMCKDTGNADYRPVVKELVRRGFIVSDTSYDYAYIVGIANVNNVDEVTGERHRETIGSIVSRLSQGLQSPVIVEYGVNAEYPIGVNITELEEAVDNGTCAVADYLEKKVGLTFRQNNHRKIRVVRFANCQ